MTVKLGLWMGWSDRGPGGAAARLRVRRRAVLVAGRPGRRDGSGWGARPPARARAPRAARARPPRAPPRTGCYERRRAPSEDRQRRRAPACRATGAAPMCPTPELMCNVPVHRRQGAATPSNCGRLRANGAWASRPATASTCACPSGTRQVHRRLAPARTYPGNSRPQRHGAVTACCAGSTRATGPVSCAPEQPLDLDRQQGRLRRHGQYGPPNCGQSRHPRADHERTRAPRAPASCRPPLESSSPAACLRRPATPRRTADSPPRPARRARSARSDQRARSRRASCRRCVRR